MLKKLLYGVFAFIVSTMPTLVRAQEAEGIHLESANLYFHIAAVILSVIATVYMLTLTASFKGGLLEKVWKRFMWISVVFTIQVIAVYLEETDIMHVHYLTEILPVIIAILLITASYKTLKQIVIKA